MFCQTLQEELERIPGDARTQIGFITFDRSLHYYNLSEGLSQPQMLVVSDVDGMQRLYIHFDDQPMTVLTVKINSFLSEKVP